MQTTQRKNLKLKIGYKENDWYYQELCQEANPGLPRSLRSLAMTLDYNH
jgi:hypothetical protein